MRRRIVILEYHKRDRDKPTPITENFKNIALGIAGIIASIAIPGIGLWLGFIQKEKEVAVANTQKNQELQKSYVELGIRVLSDAPKPGTEALRDYAVALINAHSDVKLEGEAKASVVKDVPLTTIGAGRLSPQVFRNIVNENTTLGASLSDHDNISDLRDLRNSGLKFCFVRATMGATRRDAKTGAYAAQASAIGMPFAYYHYFDERVDGLTQAHNFLDATKNLPATLPPLLDLEENPRNNSAPRADYSVQVLAFLEELKKAGMPRCVIYGTPSFLAKRFPSGIAGEPLCLARFAIGSESNEPKTPPGWVKAAFRHFTDEGFSGTELGHLDLIVFNGKMEELSSPEKWPR